jgi:hypothetical protein
MKQTQIKSRINAATFLKGPFVMAADQASDYQALEDIGIYFADRHVEAMASAMDANVLQPTVGIGSISTPVQYLQNVLPGLVRTITQARVIDEVVGMSIGGDWADDRLIPDILKAFEKNEPVIVRNPLATRPWQHVLEPLSGYLVLAQQLYNEGNEFAEGWNFGPKDEDCKSVGWILDKMVAKWGKGAAWKLDENNNPCGWCSACEEDKKHHDWCEQNGWETDYETDDIGSS